MNNDSSSWLNLGGKISVFSEETLYSLDIDRRFGAQVLSSILFRRTIFGFKAILLLVEHRLFTEANIQRRGTLEALFVLGAIKNHPEIVPDLVKNDTHRLIKLYTNLKKTSKKFRQAHMPELSDSQIEEKLNELKAQKDAPYLSPETLAQKAGLHDLYLSDYCILSEISHHKAKDLEKHVEIDDSGKIGGFSVEANEATASDILYPALEQCILSCAATNEIFSMGLNSTLSEYLRDIDEHENCANNRIHADNLLCCAPQISGDAGCSLP